MRQINVGINPTFINYACQCIPRQVFLRKIKRPLNTVLVIKTLDFNVTYDLSDFSHTEKTISQKQNNQVPCSFTIVHF